jgi:hypothetical protein
MAMNIIIEDASNKAEGGDGAGSRKGGGHGISGSGTGVGVDAHTGGETGDTNVSF